MRAIFAVLGLLLLAGCGRSEPPHVFVFLVDTLRADHLGCYGYDRPTSPEIDAFAEDAFVFHDAYSASPWTLPSVASLFTGLPPQLHGVRGRGGYLPPRATTWAERLSESGYHTAAWFTNAYLQPRYGLEQGFADYAYQEPGQMQAYMLAPDVIAAWRRSLDALPSDRPLMQYLHFMEPHVPYYADRQYRRHFIGDPEPALDWYEREDPPRSRVRYLINTYDAEIRQVDTAFGEFLTTVRERGWFDDAWIIVVSDHGEEFYEHDHYGHGNGLWENLLRVPLIVRPPGGRNGSEAGRLRELARAPVPIFALADLVAGPGTPGLGTANLEAMQIAAPGNLVPTPDEPAPPIRRASFTLDGKAGIAVAEGPRKLTWYESPSPKWFSSDLDADPEERADDGERPERLVGEIELWADLGWRGLRMTNTTTDTLSLSVRTEPREALYEVRVPVGEVPAHFRLLRRPANREVEWTGAPGQSLVLRIDAGAPLLRKDGEEWIPLEIDGLVFEPVGPPENPTDTRPEMDPALEEKLRALGYIE
jgi:arylsulfatase